MTEVKKALSKGRKWQERQRAKGLCHVCPLPRWATRWYCEPHYFEYGLVRIGMFKGNSQSPWVKRRKRVVAYAAGLRFGAQHGTIQPFLSWQAAAAHAERHLFSDVKGRWSSGRLEKLGRWLYRWDRRFREGEERWVSS